MINIKNQLLVLLFLSLLSFLNIQCTLKEKEVIKNDKPNIVLIVSDDHGQNDLGCYGNPVIRTPNLDYLATEGVRFTNAYCTSASCSASRSTILTGTYNHANGTYGLTHDINHFSTFTTVMSLPVLLKEFGNYKTARIGKNHESPESVYKFETNLRANSRNAVAMADSCVNFLHENRENPFFLYFCTSDPHRLDAVSDEPLAPNSFGNRPEGYDGVETHRFSPEEVIVPLYLPDTKECREELAQYYQSVARMDQGIGKLFIHLKEEGLWDNTIIIYISDNGIAFEGAKTNQYQAGLNLPCIIKMPDSYGKGKVNDALINWADLTPTILDFAGILEQSENVIEEEYKKNHSEYNNIYMNGFHGRSFKNILASDTVVGWDTTYGSHTFHELTSYYPMRTIITRDYKLIWNMVWQLPYSQAIDLWESSTWQALMNDDKNMFGQKTIGDLKQRPQYELYNIANDPYESKNLANLPEYKDTLEELKEKIHEFQKRTQDSWIYKSERD